MTVLCMDGLTYQASVRGRSDRLRSGDIPFPSSPRCREDHTVIRPTALLLLLALASFGACATAQPMAVSATSDYYAAAPDVFLSSDVAGRLLDPERVDAAALEAAIFHETNRRRAEQGRAPLRHLPALDVAAARHAGHMARGAYLDHLDPHHPDERTPSDRVRRVGLEAGFTAENVATHFARPYTPGQQLYPVRGRAGYSTRPGGPPLPPHSYRSFAETLVERWMQSPGHRRNLLAASARFMGGGCVRAEGSTGMEVFYCGQLFYAPPLGRRPGQAGAATPDAPPGGPPSAALPDAPVGTADGGTTTTGVAAKPTPRRGGW